MWNGTLAVETLGKHFRCHQLFLAETCRWIIFVQSGRQEQIHEGPVSSQGCSFHCKGMGFWGNTTDLPHQTFIRVAVLKPAYMADIYFEKQETVLEIIQKMSG